MESYLRTFHLLNVLNYQGGENAETSTLVSMDIDRQK